MNIYVDTNQDNNFNISQNMIVLRISVSVPEIMSISWIDLNKIIMFLVLVCVMFNIW